MPFLLTKTLAGIRGVEAEGYRKELLEEYSEVVPSAKVPKDPPPVLGLFGEARIDLVD